MLDVISRTSLSGKQFPALVRAETVSLFLVISPGYYNVTGLSELHQPANSKYIYKISIHKLLVFD